MEGADIYQVARNCRTSVEMIEKFYAAHIKTSLDAAAINVMRPKRRHNAPEHGKPGHDIRGVNRPAKRSSPQPATETPSGTAMSFDSKRPQKAYFDRKYWISTRQRPMIVFDSATSK